MYNLRPKIYRELQGHGENCIECVKAGKNLKPPSQQGDLEEFLPVVERNQEMELDLDGSLPLTREQQNTQS